MRFRKRLSAAILAVVMMISSIQIPGGISYAAEMADSSIESRQDVSVLTVEDTEDTEAGAETSAGEGAITDDGSQAGDDNPAGGDSQTGNDAPAVDDQQTDDEKDPEEGADAGEESGDDSEEPALSEDEEEGSVEEIEIDGAYQFGDAPQQSVESGISLLATTYDEKELDDYLYKEMLKRNPYIDIEKYEIAYGKENSLVSGVLNEHPDLYFVRKQFSIGVNETGNRVTLLVMYYSDEYDNDAFNASVEEALSCVNDDMSDLEKVIALHDYLAVNNEYDYINYQSGTVPEVSHTAYGALVNRISVCEGYALAYKYLLNKIGIECYMVTSDSMNHAWNMVKLDGEYYHVDVTSDDPVWDRIGRVTHTYMLFSDEAHMEKYYNWKVTSASGELKYKATDDSYDLAFWKDSTAPLVISGGDCYYVSGNGCIRKASCADIANGGPEIANVGSWPTWDNSGIWDGAYSGLYMIDGRLYYNDNSAIYSIKTDGTDMQTAFTVDTSKGYIYGSAYCQGKVYYDLHKTPNLTAKEDVLIAELNESGGDDVEEEVDPPIPSDGTVVEEGYNIENDKSLTSYDVENVFDSDGKATMIADGKAMVLIFYNSSSITANGAKTFESIVNNFKTSADTIDFYAVDTNISASNDDIKSFAQSNGISGTGVINWLYMLKSNPFMSGYISRINAKTQTTLSAYSWPTLIYIDQDNMIQYATQGNDLTADAIVANLRKYCGYSTYQITYNMNGGVNKESNPKSYSASMTEDIVLGRPYYREGYQFVGWYSDEKYTKKVTKIPAGTRSNITLYAKWAVRTGGFGLENLEQTYLPLNNEAEMTSTANGKPKLLVFYGNDVNGTPKVLTEMTEALSDDLENDLTGIDIYAIATDNPHGGSEKEDIEADQAAVSDKIAFSYDESGSNWGKMVAYAEAADYWGYGNMELRPIICYIDAQNSLQYMSIGEQTVEEVMLNLRAYCSYPTAAPEFYMIRYELNGGTNNRNNLNRYHSEMKNNITLEEPARDGYIFDGWYEDAAFTERVTEIEPERGEDITLYAKWKNRGCNLDNPEYNFVTVDSSGRGSSTAYNDRPKVLIFANENCNNSKNLIKEMTEKIDWFKGADIVCAVVTMNTANDITKANDYIDNVRKDYGCDEIKFYTDDGTNTSKLYDYTNKGNYQTVGGLRFSPVIVYIDGDNKFQYVVTRYNAESVFNDLREYCNYDAYRINYELGGGTNNSENPEVYFGGSQTITLQDPTRKSCNFEGWYKDIGFTKRVTEITAESRVDYTLYAKWSVRKGGGYGLENLTQEYTTLDGTTVSSTASGKPKVLIFGTYDSYTLLALADIKSELQKPDSLLHGVDIYLAGTGTQSAIQNLSRFGSNEIIYTYDKDGDNSAKAKAYKEAAECSGNFYNPTIVYIDENNTLQYVYPGLSSGDSAPTAADILAALKKYCNYPSYDTYTITYELNGGTNSSENPATYTTETETITLADATREGYMFEGWYKDAEFTESEKVTEIVKGSTENFTLYAKWKEVSLDEGTYRITYELNGGTNSSENPAIYTSETETITLKNATREGYTFEGWYKDAEFTESKKVTEIVKGETGDITLYAKWKVNEEDGLGIDNLDYKFAGIDGKELSSKADGKPKLLVFFVKDSTDSQNTIKNIKEIIGSLDGVDIYAIETTQASRADVTTFKNTYGCDEITFAYDDWSSPSNYRKSEAYADMAGLSAISSTIICYIDKDNKLQWVTENEQTGDEVLENLKKYCNYQPQEQRIYKITYMLDGGTNNSENPTTYTSDTETITLKDAVKDGYTFDGWYKDSKFLEQVSKIDKGNIGNITLYAKWKEKGYERANLKQSYVGLDSMQLSSTADGKPKLLVFFTTDGAASQDTVKNITEIIDSLDGADVYAIESGNASYTETTEFKDVYGCSGIKFAYQNLYDFVPNSTKAQAYLDAAGLSSSMDYPVVCYIDKDDKLQLVTVNGQTGEQILENLEKYCGYVSRKGVYSITYELNGGTNDINNPTVYTSETDTIKLKDAVRDGYTFEGWYKDAKFTESEKITEIVKGETGDITLYAKWSEASSEQKTYYIIYELNGGTNDSRNPETYTSETETIILKDPTKEGCTFEGWYKDAGFTESEKVTEIVKGETGDITLYAKWKEIPLEPGVYRITYVLNGGTNDSANPKTYTSETDTITLKDAFKTGFIFAGWYDDEEFSNKVTGIVKGSTGDIKLYAKWEAAPIDTEKIRSGLYIRFTDYYKLDAASSEPCYKYTGAAIKPAVEVYNNGTLLTLGTDYTISYKNNTKVGGASLTVKGKGSFSGVSNAVSFNITNADINTDTDHPVKMTVIAGTKVAPIIMNGDKKLTAKDYKLEGSNLVNGKYTEATVLIPNTLTVTGIGSYEGSSFTIAVNVIDKKDAKKLAVTVDKDFKPVYDGKTLDLNALFGSPSSKGSIIVTDSSDKTKVLENGKDFSVVCTSSLKAAGTVKFTVIGMGGYTGNVSKSFKISPLKVDESSNFLVTFDNKDYEYKASGTTVDNLTVKYLGDTLVSGKDYKVSYVNNKKVSTDNKKAQVKITFLGNYKGSKALTKDFKIVAAKMKMRIDSDNGSSGNTVVVVPDKVYGKANKAYKSTPIVTVEGVTIKASNYTVSYAWAPETSAGNENAYVDDPNVKITLEDSDNYARVKVTITPKGASYAVADGVTAIEGEYYVRRKAESAVDLSKAKVTFQDKDGAVLKALEYNGKAYYTPIGNNPADNSAADDPNAVYVSITVNGEPVDRSLYNVVWTNSTAKGKAVVVITGKGNSAVGSKNQAISIKAMALKGKSFKSFIEDAADNMNNMFFKK